MVSCGGTRRQRGRGRTGGSRRRSAATRDRGEGVPAWDCGKGAGGDWGWAKTAGSVGRPRRRLGQDRDGGDRGDWCGEAGPWGGRRPAGGRGRRGRQRPSHARTRAAGRRPGAATPEPPQILGLKGGGRGGGGWGGGAAGEGDEGAAEGSSAAGRSPYGLQCAGDDAISGGGRRCTGSRREEMVKFQAAGFAGEFWVVWVS